MGNRASSLFALVRGCRNSSGLREFVLVCCAMLILFCTVANAQTATGQFNGHVYDQSGAAVVGATVKVEDPATGWTPKGQSRGGGRKRRGGRPPGRRRTRRSNWGGGVFLPPPFFPPRKVPNHGHSGRLPG